MSFAVNSNFSLNTGSASTTVAIPSSGSPTHLSIFNQGTTPAFVALGTSGVSADLSSLRIGAGDTVLVPVGSNIYLAAVTADIGTLLQIQSVTIA